MARQNLEPGWDMARRLFPWAHIEPRPWIVHFERLERDLEEFAILHQLPAVVPPHIGRSDRPAWPDIFTAEMHEMVWDQYGDEAEQLGYYHPAVMLP